MPHSLRMRIPVGICRRGATAVEFAIVLPLFMLLTIACCDFCRVFRARQIVCGASRCGAQYGASQQFTADTQTQWRERLEQSVNEELQNLPNYQSELATVLLTVRTDSQNIQRIAVRISYPFETLFKWPGIPTQILLDHQVQFRNFR